MTKQKTKAQLSMELDAAQKRIAELEQAANSTARKNFKLTEQDRGEDEALYRTFIEQTNDGVAILDEQGNVRVWNSAQEKIMGISRDKVLGKKYWDVQFQLSTPETRARLSLEFIKSAFQDTFKTGEYPGLGKLQDVEIQLEDGSRKFIQISPFTVKTENGYRVGSITRDVTEQRRAADTSRENEERFSHVFHASPAQMAITDGITGKYIDVNESFLQSLGFTREEVIDKTATELNLFFDPNQRARLLGKMKEQGYLRGEEVLVCTKNGDLRHGVFSAEYIQVQNHPFLLTVMNDITEQKQMEEMLFKNQQNLLDTQSIAKLQSWTVDFQTGVINIGPGYDHILEWTAGTYKLESIKELIHPKDKEFVEKAWAQTAQNKLLDIEYRILTSGGLKWIHTKTIINEGEKHNLISGFTQDVTKRRHAEELTHAQRNLARLASTTTNQKTALPHCLNAALDVSGMDCGGIYLFDSSRQSFDLVYHSGLGEKFIQAISHYEVDAPNVQMVLAGMMFYFDEADMHSKKLYEDEGLSSLASIPIIHHGHTLGCINIASHTLNQVPEITRQAIETITTEIGTVIAHLQTENLLRDSEEKYRSLINSQESAISTLDAEGVFHYINRIGAAPLADSPEKVVGRTLYDFFPANIADWQLNQIRTVISSGQGLISEYKTSLTGKPSWRRVSIQPIQDANGQVTLAMVNSLDITDRKQAEEELKEARERLLEAQELSHIGHWEWDMKSNALIWSDEVYKIFGATPNEFTPTVESFENHIHPEDKADFLQQREKMLKEKQFASIDHRIIRLDGQIRYVQERTQISLDASGNLTRVIGTVQDITERKLTEEKRRESDDRYRLLFETMVQGVVFQDREGRIIHANPSAERILGLTLEQMQGRMSIDPRWKTIHEDGTPYPGETHPAMIALRSGNSVTNSVMGVYNPAQDTYRWLNVNAVPRYRNGDETPYQVYTTFEDITERKLAENALIFSEKKLQTLIDSQTHFVLRINLEGKYTFWNRKFEQEFGWRHRDIGIGNANPLDTIKEYHHERVLSVVKDCAEHPGQVFSVEIDKPAEDGGVRTTLWEFMCLTDEHNQPSEIQCMGVEITDRKKAEAALRESEGMYRLLAENISDVIWIMDVKSSRFSYLSPSVLQLRGYSPEEVLAQDAYASLTLASGQYLAKVMPERLIEFEQGIIKAYTDEVEQPCKDGTTVWTESTTRFVRNAETGKLEVYGVSRNITDRKKAEKRNAALIENAPDGIALVDVNGIFTFASPSAYRMFGYGPEEIVGIQSREKVHPQDVYLLANLREKLYATPNKQQTMEYRFLHKDGSYRWLESTYTNMFGEPGIEGIVINFRDITDRKLSEEITHQQSEQLRLLYEASQQLNRTLDVKEIYQTICDFMAIIAPSDTLFISAFDSDTQLITCKAYWMENNWLDVSPFPAIPLEEEGKGTQSRVIRSGQAMLLNDYQAFLKTSQNIYYVEDETNEITREGPEDDEEDVTRSAMIVPLKSGGLVKGIIQVASYHQDAYTEDQLKLLEALSLHIASAEQNALLYSQLLAELNERKQVEEALLKSEALLMEAQRIGRIGHMEWNGRGNELICSKELYDILGLPQDVVLTQETIGHMMFAEDIATLQRQDMASFQLRKDLNYQYRIHLADGSERWLHQISKMTYNEDSAPIRMMAVIQDITERKQTENALRDSEARAHAMLQAIPDLMFRMNRQGVFMDYKADTSQLAIQESDLPLIGKRNRDVSLPEFAGLIETEIEKTLETGELQSFEYKLEVPKFGVRDYEARMTPSGKDEVLAIVRDITEQNKAKSALRASEEKYRGLIESLDNVVVSMDVQGRVLYINDIAATQLGGTAQEMIGKTMYELFPEAVAITQMKQIQQVVREDKGSVFESISMIKGEPRWYRTSMQPIHDEEGLVSQVLINSTDIHNLKTTQQELQELNRTLEERVKQRTAEVQDLYENSPAGYHSLDANGKIILINETELKWLGYNREELIGKSILDLLTPASIAIFKSNFPAFKQNGFLKDLEIEFTRKDGTVLPTLINATASYDESGTYILSRTTMMDNTEHKAADEALRNANLELARAMRMKDEFLASMSHELRTPLNGILGLSEALQLDVYGPLNEKQKSTLGHVEDSGRHLLELINDILDVSKIEAGKFELEMLPCSLGDICQSSIHLTKGMAGKKHQNVNFNMNPASININADARRLKQVLVNLLSNAVKFTPENGSLGLDVSKNETDNIVYISVWDNGIGISQEDIKKLFQPFVQLDSSLSRQQTGTGLGLTLVQRLIEMHGGSIEIKSAPGQGSRFTVALPSLPENSTTETFDNLLQSKFQYALIVEDETMDAGHLARYCRALGITPILHATGEGVVERAIATRPNIVFLDLNLPDISGWEVLTRLRTHPETQSIPIVITSVDDEKQRASQLNVDGYLVKFFAVSDLRAVLENIQKASITNEGMVHSANQPTATVMIVDDNEINIETVVDYLSSKNFNVVSSQSGVDFLTRVPKIYPDIILMDIQMPELDGLETTRRLRAMPDQKLASVPVIALTALAMPGDRELCIEAGADEYVTKPFRLREIQELITKMLEDKKREL